MGQWPPSPSVEDEDTALANEHCLDGILYRFKSDNQGATAPGPVDQYPILIDTASLKETQPIASRKHEKQSSLVSDISSSEDNAGPPTPPPVLPRMAQRSDSSQMKYNSSAPMYTSMPEPTIPTQQSAPHGRPMMPRIQTDLGRDANFNPSGDRLPSSSYTHTRAPTFHHMDAEYTAAAEQFLSPAHAMSSPWSSRVQQQQSQPSTARGYNEPRTPQVDYRSPVVGHSRQNGERINERQSSMRDVPTIRYGVQSQSEARTPRALADTERRRSFYEVPARTYIDSPQMSPAHSRRPSKESSYTSSGEDLNSGHRPYYSRKSTRDVRDVRDSPYTSSAEEAGRSQGRKSAQTSGDERLKSRRRSSHRKERPVFVDRSLRTESLPVSAIDDGDTRYHRRDTQRRHHANPLTPMSGDVNKADMEDVFERAFRDNARRKSQSRSGPRTSGSVLVSPMTSPPRTPRSEGHSKDYFDFTPTTQRPAQRSRPPSMDESQLKDKHGSLLSVATAGATLAARSSGGSSRSSGPSTDVSPSTATSKPASAPRSRRPSPVQEESKESVRNSVPTKDQTFPNRTPVTPNFEVRPISRGNTTNADHPHNSNQHPAHSYRTHSHSGLEHAQPWSGSSPPSAVSPAVTTAQPIPGLSNMPPQSRSARSSLNQPSTPAIRSLLDLPTCPRRQPAVGYRDWYTIKEMSDIELCPTCVGAMSNTRFRECFVPSIPRPYNEPSVCAMSQPWVRIAFLQSLRQSKPDLKYIRDIVESHKNLKPCAGNKRDIRPWYTVIDTQTREPIPDFVACSHCVRAVDQLFPDICEVFCKSKDKLSQERVCSIHTASKHFPSLIDELEYTQLRCRGFQNRWRSSDIESILRYLHRVARYKPCTRDEMQMSRTWHIMPDIPEFTICEECYDEVVRPVQDRHVARDITRSLKKVPVRRGSDGTSGISCQLYSDRMRKVFADTVISRDLKRLHDVVKTRVSAQQRLSSLNRIYEEEMKCGIDRRQEIERNREIWRSFE